MLLGYARVSTADQTTAMQLDRLLAEGVHRERIYQDAGVSGIKARPELAKALSLLGQGDTLVTYSFSRLGRSTLDLCQIAHRIESQGANLRSLTEQVDTSTPSGRLYFHMLAALAQFERELLAERTKAGLEATKRRGTRLGRPTSLSRDQLDHAREQVAQGKAVRELAGLLGVDRGTLYRRLRAGA